MTSQIQGTSFVLEMLSVVPRSSGISRWVLVSLRILVQEILWENGTFEFPVVWRSIVQIPSIGPGQQDGQLVRAAQERGRTIVHPIRKGGRLLAEGLRERMLFRILLQRILLQRILLQWLQTRKPRWLRLTLSKILLVSKNHWP